MPTAFKALTQENLNAYRRDGFLAPVRAFSTEDAARYRKALEDFEQAQGMPLMKCPDKPTLFAKSHLLFRWVDEIVRHPAILDAVEDIIGPNFRVFHNNVFVKEPHSPAFVSWHQDGSYNGIMPPDVLTTWVALSNSNATTGCVRILRGSHQEGLRAHVDRKSDHNILSRGQQIEGLATAEAVNMALEPGEMSIHHTFAVHCSEPNESDQRRIGVMSTYVPTHCRYVRPGRPRMRAALVRGVDEYGHFDDESTPASDFGPAERAAHRESCERYIANVTSSENKQLLNAG